MGARRPRGFCFRGRRRVTESQAKIQNSGHHHDDDGGSIMRLMARGHQHDPEKSYTVCGKSRAAAELKSLKLNSTLCRVRVFPKNESLTFPNFEGGELERTQNTPWNTYQSQASGGPYSVNSGSSVFPRHSNSASVRVRRRVDRPWHSPACAGQVLYGPRDPVACEPVSII